VRWEGGENKEAMGKKEVWTGSIRRRQAGGESRRRVKIPYNLKKKLN
jgi:hypothetical protein